MRGAFKRAGVSFSSDLVRISLKFHYLDSEYRLEMFLHVLQSWGYLLMFSMKLYRIIGCGYRYRYQAVRSLRPCAAGPLVKGTVRMPYLELPYRGPAAARL